ncbi:MAG: hypothetical protein WAM14_08245 [Candidatus Nitrosopolaris sp.]
MANSLIMGFDGNSGFTGFVSTSQAYFNINQLGHNGAISGSTGNENYCQAPFVAGTSSNLWCRVKTAASSSSTVVLRKNAANSNETISITANTTGAFSDSIHTYTTASGDLIDVAVTPGSTSLIIIIIAITFAANTNTVSKLGMGSGASQGSTGTFFSTLSSLTADNTNFLSTKSQAKNRQRKPMTINNLAIFVPTNGSGISTFKSRKNGANGNLSISVSANSTGLFQDISHSDSVSKLEMILIIHLTQEATNLNQFLPMLTFQIQMAIQFSHVEMTRYRILIHQLLHILGCQVSLTLQKRLKQMQVTINNAFTFSQLTTNVASNGITNASTVTLRANAGSSGVSVSIGGSSTGVFTDAVNTYTSATTDAMNYQIVTASTGTSMKLAFISVCGSLSTAAPATTYRSQSFRNIPVGAAGPRIAMTTFGNGSPIFG